MTLLLYRDADLREPLDKVKNRDVHRFELPRNSPGGLSKSSFYIYNDSENPVEELQILHDNRQVEFYYKDQIPPKNKSEVTVEWRAPVSFKEALTLFFKIEAVEVVRPRI